MPKPKQTHLGRPLGDEHLSFMKTEAQPNQVSHSLALDESGILSWVHFGDLHITGEHEQNYRDFLALIAQTNEYFSDGTVSFAFLPGDNADNGTEDQYRLIHRALDGLRLPRHIIPGDHDIQTGKLETFRKYLEPKLPKSFIADRYRCIFLNSVDIEGRKGFGHRREQLSWLAGELETAAREDQCAVLFMHTYPSELGDNAQAVGELIRGHEVLVVEMGHTHYNEIANDGRVIYAATRSTGQIEEGPVGFSITNLDRGVVSWKFKALESEWPFVMITSPVDRRFMTRPEQLVRGTVEVRAKVWDRSGIVRATCWLDDAEPHSMSRIGRTAAWHCTLDLPALADGSHRLTVLAENANGGAGEDTITILSNQAGLYEPPARAPGDEANSIGAYPEKGIPGTQLGPNKNGRKW